MKITIQEYTDAKAKLDKLKERMTAFQTTVKNWEEASKLYGKPREGDEVVSFHIEDGAVEAVTRRLPIQKSAVGT